MAATFTVANKFLELAMEQGNPLTQMQLLKLVYIAHGWTLGLYGRPLIGDEIQAWQYGPVIPKLYNKVRHYKSKPITESIASNYNDTLRQYEEDIICQVYKLYGHKTGADLSRLTHAKGTPWDQTYEEGVFSIPISNDLIEDHYARMAASMEKHS